MAPSPEKRSIIDRRIPSNINVVNSSSSIKWKYFQSGRNLVTHYHRSMIRSGKNEQRDSSLDDNERLRNFPLY